MVYKHRVFLLNGYAMQYCFHVLVWPVHVIYFPLVLSVVTSYPVSLLCACHSPNCLHMFVLSQCRRPSFVSVICMSKSIRNFIAVNPCAAHNHTKFHNCTVWRVLALQCCLAAEPIDPDGPLCSTYWSSWWEVWKTCRNNRLTSSSVHTLSPKHFQLKVQCTAVVPGLHESTLTVCRCLKAHLGHNYQVNQKRMHTN